MWAAIHSFRLLEARDTHHLNHRVIFDAKPGEYQKATERIWHKPGTASYVSLPVVPIAQ